MFRFLITLILCVYSACSLFAETLCLELLTGEISSAHTMVSNAVFPKKTIAQEGEVLNVTYTIPCAMLSEKNGKHDLSIPGFGKFVAGDFPSVPILVESFDIPDGYDCVLENIETQGSSYALSLSNENVINLEDRRIIIDNDSN